MRCNMPRKIIDPIERFNIKYIVDPDTGCWNWTAGYSNSGYGHFMINKKMVKAHRFAYEHYVGPLDKDLMICHNCNNPKCCNPNHLRQDTRSSNVIDMIEIKNLNVQILSVDEVIEIKKALKHYYRGQIKDLAHFYKVDQRTISAINKGKNWSHIHIP